MLQVTHCSAPGRDRCSHSPDARRWHPMLGCRVDIRYLAVRRWQGRRCYRL